MKCDIVNLDNQNVGSMELADSVFAVEVRADILSRVVNWQLANRRAGTHKTKTIAEVSGTTKKTVQAERYGACPSGIFACDAVPRRRHQLWAGRSFS